MIWADKNKSGTKHLGHVLSYQPVSNQLPYHNPFWLDEDNGRWRGFIL